MADQPTGSTRSAAVWIGRPSRRVRAARGRHHPSSPRDAAFAQSLELEIGAIRHVYELARSPVFARVAERIANADAVYILGIQSTRGISNAFYSYLEYIRPRASIPTVCRAPTSIR